MTQPNDDTIRAVESFLGKLPGAEATSDAAMRGFGRSVGMFILGMLDAGVDPQIAIYEAAAYIKVCIETYAKPSA